MAKDNLQQQPFPLLQQITETFFDRQIRLADRLLAEAFLRDCLKEERWPEAEN